MSDFDALTAVQDAVYDALSARLPAGSALYENVPEGAQPPFWVIGDMSAEPSEDKDGEDETVIVEIACVYRGTARLGLFAMIRPVKAALKDQPIFATDADLGSPTLLNVVASRADADGVTYEAVLRFQIFAQPA